ncbi:MAG: sporulation protein [Dysosmobacter welbionis]
MADTGLPVPRRPAGVVSGGRRGRAGQCGGSFGPLCPFRGPLTVPLPGGLLSAAGSGVRGAGRPLAGGADGAAVPGPRCWQCCAGAGVGGGYPIGAKTAADLYRENLVSREEAERLLAFCNNSNPVFLISVLGVGVFGSVRAGVWLWLIHVLSALLTGLVFRGSGKSASRQELTRRPPFRAVSFAEAFTGAVRSSLAGILSVCAFVVFFYVLAQPLTAVGGRLGAVLVAALELFSLTPLLTADAFGFLLAAAAAGWGGLSVLCQTLAVLEGSGLRLRNCFLGKVVQSAFSLLLAALLVGYVLG